MITAYNESYSKAIAYILHNYSSLITNKIILYALASQATEVGNLILTQKFYQQRR
ncbi:MAG: hypothetical protein O7C59_02070 [Rickettsia endosymbiont of Ixodes persulcatus]|nr:hypothetical protein [Rickettsia endosymbiont of Ixodes persulcatus]MCZ6909909.1 hypothetical protein [Rickettsia endosymbiont of Ixodes persulcatus]MCZ6913399.1 hypothetical protein [Rickettsia endosymbiont of Ixodes persulcatus]MCZ6919104.1 hypothetical protein [Rickettsia endosymbiont of Ixodes persulcatus]MCZ6924204.1 hypothetical protein [Rickettsia endosymbiont of Ixodes persulcatus]